MGWVDHKLPIGILKELKSHLLNLLQLLYLFRGKKRTNLRTLTMQAGKAQHIPIRRNLTQYLARHLSKLVGLLSPSVISRHIFPPLVADLPAHATLTSALQYS